MAGRPKSRAKAAERTLIPLTGTADEADPTYGLLPARVREHPAAWKHWPVSKRIEYCFSAGLDNLEEVLSWNPQSLDDTRFRGWKEATMGIVNIGARYGLQRMKTDDAANLRRISRKLEAREGEAQDVVCNRRKRSTTDVEKP